MKKEILLIVLLLTVNTLMTFAQTWDGSVNTDWNTAANWTPANVPGASSTVIINNMSAPNQPLLAGNVSIASLNMSAGILNLNGFAITCTGNASFTGDSLLNGKVIAGSFNNIQNMRMGGKIILDKTGAGNDFWGGNNKVYNDSLIVIWRSGALHLEIAAADSIFSHFKIQAANSSTVSFSENFLLYVRDNLIIDNIGNGTFSWNSAINNVIGGNLVTLNFLNTATNLIFKNITTLGSNANGPFKCLTGSISNCSFNGNFTLIADSSQGYTLNNAAFLGTDNLIQAETSKSKTAALVKSVEEQLF
jgi:hypothetical protein